MSTGLRRLTSRGDTIVEVLLAIAAVSMVLGGAFVTANKSLNGNRQAQERGEVTKLLESQLEQLKELAKTDDTVFTGGPNPFCMNGTTRVVVGNPACQQGVGGRYRLQILRTGSSRFEASANWDKAGGGQEQASIIYRMHPGD